MAMLHVVASLSKPLGLDLRAHGVDHGLRPEAQAELDGADELASALGIPFTRSKILVFRGANLQARARGQRYEELRKVAQTLSAQFIATAHHADDRAETVLMRLMRGAGPAGLGVLPPRTRDLLRPLIRARKSDIHAHLRRHRIQFSEDPSNVDSRYLRTRVRNSLLPDMLSESPAIVQHLNSLADRMLELSDGGNTSLGISRSQAEELRRFIQIPREGAEIALGGGWVLKLERKKIRRSTTSE
jgi:tRNA(Ile)-lysidine synthase